jgi:hypothetical protein
MTAGSLRKIVITLCAGAFAAVALALIAAPLITAGALKLWLNRVARQNGWSISYRSLEAPLLRPVTVRDVKIVVAGRTVDVAQIQADLRLAALFDRSRGRAIRNLVISDLHGEFAAAPSPPIWAALLADNFTVTSSALAVRSTTATIELHDAELSASELQPGTLQIGSLTVRSPALEQKFVGLRGGTSWEYNRLTIGGVTIMRGLDVDVFRVDLARAAEKRIGIEADLDLFGGQLRASMSADEQEGKRTWDIAASGSEISLGRMSDALEFANRTSGSLHALKFTFRGNFGAVADATASLWTEITGFSWRDRTADVVMLGASYYSRQVNVEQLYVKQRRNELTFSGEFALPRTSTELPDLRGDLSATIGDLGEFARLFGGNPADFAGDLTVNGSATAQERNLSGQAVVSGKSLKVFGAPIDAIDGRVLLSRSALEIDQCELRRDSAGLPPMSVHGRCDFADANAMRVTLQFDQPLAFQDLSSGCVSEMRLADSSAPQPSSAIPFSTLEFSGPLFRTAWTIAARQNDEPAKTFTFCAHPGETGGALVIAPVR